MGIQETQVTGKPTFQNLQKILPQQFTTSYLKGSTSYITPNLYLIKLILFVFINK